MLVIGFRHGAAMAVLPLTKVTIGIAMLWPLLRREWPTLAQAMIVTAVVPVASIVVQGFDVWVAWFEHLAALAAVAGQTEQAGALVSFSLVIRLPVAVGIASWGALSGRRWTIPVAVTLAMPLLWIHSFAVFVALQPLMANRREVLLRG